MKPPPLGTAFCLGILILTPALAWTAAQTASAPPPWTTVEQLPTLSGLPGTFWKVTSGTQEGIGHDGPIDGESKDGAAPADGAIDTVYVDVSDDPNDADDFYDALQAALACLQHAFGLTSPCGCSGESFDPVNFPLLGPADTYATYQAKFASKPGFLKKIAHSTSPHVGIGTEEFVALGEGYFCIPDPACVAAQGSKFNKDALALIVWHELQHANALCASGGPSTYDALTHHALIYHCQATLITCVIAHRYPTGVPVAADDWLKADLTARYYVNSDRFDEADRIYRIRTLAAPGSGIDPESWETLVELGYILFEPPFISLDPVPPLP